MRSPQLMSSGDSALLVVDVQERLLPFIGSRDVLIDRCRLLIRCAKVLGIPVLATEQYPKGLGKTVAPLAELLEAPTEKVAFSACGAEPLRKDLGRLGRSKVLVCGIEAHVCVQQTAFDLLADGYQVYLAADAVGSRRGEDKHWALARMAHAGVSVTTAEAAVFEWTESAGTQTFKQISQYVKEVDVPAQKGSPS
jgi:nicotinamidase-related amidase